MCAPGSTIFCARSSTWSTAARLCARRSRSTPGRRAMQPDRAKILQVLYDGGANDPTSALFSEDVIQKTRMSWDEILKEAIYLQGKQQIVMRSRTLGNRVLY